MYDYHKTNNQTTAKSTKDADDDFDDTNRGTTPGELVMVDCIKIGGIKQPYFIRDAYAMAWLQSWSVRAWFLETTLRHTTPRFYTEDILKNLELSIFCINL